jgi:SAM-dependent methyltransferase
LLDLAETGATDWLEIVKNEFDHPAVVLWRAIELRQIEKVLRKYKLEKPILDLGCAEGKVADMIFGEDRLIGLDNCWELLKENQKTNTYKALILGDGCFMPYKSAVFASVFSNCVLEHIPDIYGLLGEVSRILKTKGLFLFTVPSYRFPDNLFFSNLFRGLRLKRLAEWYKHKRNALLQHYHCYDHNNWQSILKEKKMDLIKHEYYMTKVATCVWDFWAACIVVLGRLHMHKLMTSKNPMIYTILKHIYQIYPQKYGLGSGLLMVAQKRNE